MWVWFCLSHPRKSKRLAGGQLKYFNVVLKKISISQYTLVMWHIPTGGNCSPSHCLKRDYVGAGRLLVGYPSSPSACLRNTTLKFIRHYSCAKTWMCLNEAISSTVSPFTHCRVSFSIAHFLENNSPSSF